MNDAAAADPERATSRLGGVGLRPAMVLVVAFVTPPAYAIAAAVTAGFDGFPTLLAVLVTVLSAVSGAVLFGTTPSPSILQLLGRGLTLALATLVLRLLTPSLTTALSDIGWELTGTFAPPYGRMLVAIVAAHAVGHGVAAKVALFADGPRTRYADRAGEEGMFGMWLVAVAVSVVAVGLANQYVGVVGAVVTVVAVTVGGATVAHLRATTPRPGGRRPAIVVGSPRLWRAAVAGTLAITAVFTFVAVASLPPAITEASPRFIAWVSQVDFEPETPRFAPRDDGERVTEGGDAGVEIPEDIEQRERPELDRAPTWPFVLIGAALVTWLLVYLLREDRWSHVWRAVWRWLRLGRGGRRGSDEEYGAVEPLERARSSRSVWTERLERFRPRPRDPRGAILHDYLRAERTLARQDLGRDRWETPLEHAARLGLDEEHRELADLASTARYGRAEPPEETAERTRELSRHVVRAVKGYARSVG